MSEVATRAKAFAALGDVSRLLVVEALVWGDLAVDELAELVGMRGNLLAHHLHVLEDAGLITRTASEGDRRRRYVALDWSQMPTAIEPALGPVNNVVFVCTHNSARSQFAAALWEKTTGKPAISAGSNPSPAVSPRAIQVAAEFGVDISGSAPGGYERIAARPDLVVGVCDRAWEGGVPDAKRHLHWSVPDPVQSGTLAAFRSAFADLSRRVNRLARGTTVT